MLIPHLEMLSRGVVHLTQEPPADADAYNKLVEVYWATLLMANGSRVLLDWSGPLGPDRIRRLL